MKTFIRVSPTSIVFVPLLTLFSVSGSCLAADNDWQDRLHKDAPGQWRALREFYSQIECSWTETIAANFPKPANAYQCKKRLLLKDDLIRLEVTEITKGDRQGAVVVTPQYVFNVKWSSDSKSFVLKYFGKVDPFGVDAEFRPCVQAPFYYESRLLQDWLQNTNLTTKRVTPVPSGEKDLVRWEWEYKPTKQETDQGRRPFNSVLQLDPEKYWCICSFETTFSSYTVSGSVEYGSDLKGFPVVESVTVRTRSNDGRERNDTRVIEKFLPRVVPDSEFTLSAFGLPEAVNADSPPRRTPLYVWLLVAAAASAGAACLVRFIARRRKAPV